MGRLMESGERTRSRANIGNTRFYQYISDGLWTPGVRIGKRAVAWPSDENDKLIAARVAGWSDDQIRQLVRELLDARKNAVETAA